LREERRLRVFENRVLRRIFGPKRNEVINFWIKTKKYILHRMISSFIYVKSRRDAGKARLFF
jgi:hypothetical protein